MRKTIAARTLRLVNPFAHVSLKLYFYAGKPREGYVISDADGGYVEYL